MAAPAQDCGGISGLQLDSLCTLSIHACRTAMYNDIAHTGPKSALQLPTIPN
jgi:hypothetical protein